MYMYKRTYVCMPQGKFAWFVLQFLNSYMHALPAFFERYLNFVVI